MEVTNYLLAGMILQVDIQSYLLRFGMTGGPQKHTIQTPHLRSYDWMSTRWAPYDRYKWSYGAPINGRKYMGFLGVISLLIVIITPFITSREPTLQIPQCLWLSPSIANQPKTRPAKRHRTPSPISVRRKHKNHNESHIAPCVENLPAWMP